MLNQTIESPAILCPRCGRMLALRVSSGIRAGAILLDRPTSIRCASCRCEVRVNPVQKPSDPV